MRLFSKKNKRQITSKDLQNAANEYSLFLTNVSKKLIWIIIVCGCAWITFSYVLAYMDKVQIAESLSTTACTTVIGSFAVYIISKTIENVFRYNPKFGGSSQFPEDIATRINESEIRQNGEQGPGEYRDEPNDLGT